MDCQLVQRGTKWVCSVCHRAIGREARRTCLVSIIPPSAEQVEAFLDELYARNQLGLATVAWTETERRVGICQSCRYMAPPAADVEMRCRACSGCSGDSGFKFRVALTTGERPCPKKKW